MGRFDNPRESSDTDWRLHVRTREGERTDPFSRTDYQLGLTDIPDHSDVRTDYQYGLTDIPDDEGDLSRDLYALQT